MQHGVEDYPFTQDEFISESAHYGATMKTNRRMPIEKISTYRNPNSNTNSTTKISKFRQIVNQKHILILASLLPLGIHCGFTAAYIAFSVSQAPNVFGNLAQPICLYIFYFLHSWLNLGLLNSLFFLVTNFLLAFGFELFITSPVSGNMAKYTLDTFIPDSTVSALGGLAKVDGLGTHYAAVLLRQVPLEIPISYFLIVYPCFFMAECLVHGTAMNTRSRFNDEASYRKPIHEVLLLPLVTAVLATAMELMMQPLLVFGSLIRFSDTMPQTSNDLTFFNIPYYYFAAFALVVYIMVAMYLLFEYVLDRMLACVYSRLIYSKSTITSSTSAAPGANRSRASATTTLITDDDGDDDIIDDITDAPTRLRIRMKRFTRVALYESWLPPLLQASNYYQWINVCLPLVAIAFQGAVYMIVVDPGFLRIMSTVIWVLFLLLIVSRFELSSNKTNNGYNAVN